MNVGQLRKIIEGLDDSVKIMESYTDHELAECSFETATAFYNKKHNYFYQDFGDEYKNSPDDVRIEILYIT